MKFYSMPLLAAAVFALPSVVLAEAWVLEPTLKILAKTDDNFTLDDRRSRQQDVTTARATASLSLNRLTEAVETQGLLRIDAIDYSGDVDGDPGNGKRRLEGKVNYVASLSSFYKTPLSNWGIETSIKEDTVLKTLDPNEEGIGSTEDPSADEGLTRRNIGRSRFILKPSYSTRLSERISIRFQYGFNDVSYSNQPDNLIDQLVEHTDHTLSGTYSYKYTPKDFVSLRLRLKQYATETFTRDDTPGETRDIQREYDSYSLTAGWEHQFNQTTKAGIELGVRETDQETRTQFSSGAASTVTGRTNSGELIKLSGSKRTGLTRYVASVKRDLFSSGSGDLVQADEYVLNVTSKWTELIDVSVRSRLFQNRVLRDTGDDRADRRYVSIRPAMTWKFSPWWRFVASYEYRREKRDDEPESAVSNAVSFAVAYSKPTTLD